MLQWLLQEQPPHFITQAITLWMLLRAVGRVWSEASNLQFSPPMLSLAVQVMPISQAYMQLQVPAPGEAATSDTSSNSSTRSNSQSTRASFETLQKAISDYQGLVMGAVLFTECDRERGRLREPLPADVEALQKQLLFGPASHVAAMKLTAACRYLHAKHSRRLEKKKQERRQQRQQQQQQQRSGYRRAPRSSSSNGGGQGSTNSSSNSRHGFNRASAATAAAEACLAKESAFAVPLFPDHEPMAAVLGENAVATFCRAMDAGGSAKGGLMVQIKACIDILGGVGRSLGVYDGIPTAPAARASSQQQVMQSAPRSGAGAGASSGGGSSSSRGRGSGGSSSTNSSGGASNTTSSSSASGGWNSAMLTSAPCLQLLLELLALLVAEGELRVVAMCVDLLDSVLTGAPKAERRVFISARGGLLVKVLGLVVQAAKEQQQQQQGVQQEDRDRASLERVTADVLHCMLAAVRGASGEDVSCEWGNHCWVWGYVVVS